MTYAFILVKGKSTSRESSLSLLEKLAVDRDFSEQNKISIEKVFISFGWPDIIILMHGINVELIKNAIVVIRDKLSQNGDGVDTSTIICTTSEEIKKQKKEWGLFDES